LALLYCLLQSPEGTEVLCASAGIVAAALESGQLDAAGLERCQVIFPTILEVVSSVDRLEPAVQDEAVRQLRKSEAAFGLSPRAERSPRLQAMVVALRRVLDRMGPAGSGERQPKLVDGDGLDRLARAAIAGASSGHRRKPSGSDCSEFFSCSDEEPGEETTGQACTHSASASSSVAGKAAQKVSSQDAGETEDSSLYARAKLDQLWEQLRCCPAGPPRYPDPMALLQDVQAKDYSSLLHCTADLHPAGVDKVICSAGGAVAPVAFRWRPHARKRFSGMFRAADHGVIRCSSVSEPQAPSRFSLHPAMVPMVALKFFRDGGAQSANIVLAHKKSGHKDTNFLAHAVSNHFTENIMYPFTAVLKIFRKYSEFPTFTGCAEFASVAQDGSTEPHPVSPYALVLHAPPALRRRSIGPTKHLSEQFAELAAGDVLYEAYAVPEPLAERAPRGKMQIWRIGELVLRAPFVSSELGDKKLFFQHHLFEGDLHLRPDWRSKADKMVGAPFYQERIEAGDVWSGDEGG